MHRAQILLDPQQHRALRELAERQGRSISSIVREMINDQLLRLKKEQEGKIRHYLDAIERIRDHKRAVLDKRGGRELAVDIANLIEENRIERDGRIVETGRLSDD
jgi:hypothetical protein